MICRIFRPRLCMREKKEKEERKKKPPTHNQFALITSTSPIC